MESHARIQNFVDFSLFVDELSLRETSWRKIECFLSFQRNLVEYFAPGDEQRIDKIWLEIFCKKINFEIKTGLQIINSI